MIVRNPLLLYGYGSNCIYFVCITFLSRCVPSIQYLELGNVWVLHSILFCSASQKRYCFQQRWFLPYAFHYGLKNSSSGWIDSLCYSTQLHVGLWLSLQLLKIFSKTTFPPLQISEAQLHNNNNKKTNKNTKPFLKNLFFFLIEFKMLT